MEIKDSGKRHGTHPPYGEGKHSHEFMVYWITTIQCSFMKSSHIEIQVFAWILPRPTQPSERKLYLRAEEFSVE